jgi:hypothetical protein
MTDQKRTQPQSDTPPDTGRRERPDDQEPDRFDRKRVNRDRAVAEQDNQGQGPMHVGDQSRTRG